MEQFLEKSQNSGEITWTRVKRSNGKYGYVRTKNRRPVDFDEYTGKFKMYDLPDTNSNWSEASKMGASLGKIKSIERKPDSHADYMAQQKLVDEHVKSVTPTAVDLFNIGTLGGLNNLSPTQWVRRVYDLGEAIKGNMSWDKFGNNWFYGNNGLVSDEYAQEHPYASTAINLVGDAGAFGALSTLRKLPKYAALMEAENRAAQEATAINWRDMLANSTRRTKLGDVEVDNPGLYYHQSAAGKAKNFVSTGRMRTPLEESWLAKEKAGEHIPIMLRTGVTPGYPQNPGRAMFSQGELWYGLDTRRNPDLLVTAEEMPIANSKAGVMSSKASLKKLESQGSRRVTDDNIYTQGPHNVQNTTAYTWKPGYGYRRVVAEEPSTSLKFFERPQSKISEAERLGIPKGERNFKPKWHVANYPGYLLKGLMGGSPLERQLSKNGTININLLNAYFNKASQIEKEVANKVLAEKFAGLKTIDYNLFKRAVLDELIGKYNRNYNALSMIPTVTTEKMMAYGGDRLGIIKDFKDISDGTGGLVTTWTEKLPVSFKQFTFETPKISIGNRKHYSGQPIGHTRTFTNQQEPLILHVMESQSDWAQKSLGLTKAEKTAIQNIDEQLKTGTPTGFSTLEELLIQKQAILDRASQRTQGISYLSLHLHDNYLQRLLQENLRYAAENGLTKMRYPTSETAAKIEGYLKKPRKWFNLEGEEVLLTLDTYDPVTFEIKPWYKEAFGNFTHSSPEYTPEHQTILKKYSDFPKLFLKLFKDLKVGTVSDTKGNTWYEVDVPKGYLSREWQFKQGGKMNTVEQFKNGSKIHIKKKNRGKFTDYCGGEVTQECIRKAKASGNPTLVKRATFADNARKWKHKEGGKAFVDDVNVLDSNPRIYKYLTKIKVSPRGVVKKLAGGSFVNNALNFINSDTGQSIIGGVSSIIQGMSAKKKLNKAINTLKKAIDELYNVAKNNIDMGAINSLAQANLELRMALSPGIHFGEIDLGYERNKLKLEALAKAANEASTWRNQALANLNSQASLMSNEASNNITGNIGGLLNGAFQLAGNYFSNKTSSNTVKPGYTYSKITSNNFSVPKTNFSVNMKL